MFTKKMLTSLYNFDAVTGWTKLVYLDQSLKKHWFKNGALYTSYHATRTKGTMIHVIIQSRNILIEASTYATNCKNMDQFA